MVGSCCSLAVIVDSTEVHVLAVDVEVLDCAAGEALLDACTSRFQSDRALLLDRRRSPSSHLPRSGACRPLRRRSLRPGRSTPAPPWHANWSMPELKATTGMPLSTAALTGGRSASGLRQRDGDSVDTAVDGVLDQVALLRPFGITRVLEFDVVLLRRGLGALADEIPEGVAWHFVSDHRDRDARGVHATARHHPRRRCLRASRRCWSRPPARQR